MYDVAMDGVRMLVKYWGVIPNLSCLLRLLQRRTPLSVGMYLKKGGKVGTNSRGGTSKISYVVN